MVTAIPQLESFREAAERAAERGPEWLRASRLAALDRFLAAGFPTTRDEEWRFTSVAPIADTRFAPGSYEPAGLSDGALEALLYDDSEGWRLVFVNGHLSRELSRVEGLPIGVEVAPLSLALESDDANVESHLCRLARVDTNAFAALNAASFSEGAYVAIERDTSAPAPIHLVYLSAPNPEGDTAVVSHPRTLIVAGENSQATIVESYAAVRDGTYFTNAVTEAVLAAGAQIDHVKINRESRHAFHIATIQATLERGSRFANHAVTLGGAISRNDINAWLGGEGAEATLNGLFLGSGRQLIDTHTRIDHAVPHCPSHELYKGILDDHSHGVFNGKIYVHEDAQKTDAKQTNQNLLLSRDASIDTKPQLEIFADDVRCTHGCTVGQLQEEAIFYLRSRGIGLQEARGLLTYAFASDITSRIPVAPLRRRLEESLFQREAPLLEAHGFQPEPASV